jgi:hypothetical protein
VLIFCVLKYVIVCEFFVSMNWVCSDSLKVSKLEGFSKLLGVLLKSNGPNSISKDVLRDEDCP